MTAFTNMSKDFKLHFSAILNFTYESNTMKKVKYSVFERNCIISIICNKIRYNLYKRHTGCLEKNVFFLQFNATPPSSTLLLELSKVVMHFEFTVNVIGRKFFIQPITSEWWSQLPHRDKRLNRLNPIFDRSRLYRKWYSTGRRGIIF